MHLLLMISNMCSHVRVMSALALLSLQATCFQLPISNVLIPSNLRNTQSSAESSTTNENDHHIDTRSRDVPPALDRRSLLVGATSAAASISFPISALAADKASTETESAGMVSPTSVARRLSIVPTFTIVDTRGVPFMVFGEDAKLTAYFFTSYDEAKRILDVAIASSDKSLADLKRETRDKRKAEGLKPLSRKEEKGELGINPWREARISTVPLDFAVTLATKSNSRSGYFRVTPNEDDVADALELDSKSGKTELAEGKVPLFYFEDFKIPRSDVPSIDDPELPADEISPVYFSKAALLEAYKGSPAGKKGDALPEIKVTELKQVITAMIDPGIKDDDLKSLVFVPPSGSAKRAKECEKKGGKEKPFLIGERIVAY